jgi:AMMECR1 domain-containing protein
VGAERHPFPPFAWKTLRHPLSEEQRAEVSRGLRDLLRFQSTLARWRSVGHAPDATPFVSLYANGRLCGCQGSDEGSPSERLERAFLRALHDGRFTPVSPGERAALAAQVSYVLRPRLLNPESAAGELEIGTHGVALVRDRLPGVMLLPHVARDERLGPRELLGVLLRKARASDEALSEGGLYAFDAEDVVVHEAGPRPRSRAVGAEAAAAWLASLVDDEGAITFAIDPRTRRRVAHGEMHHGRAAVVVQALAAHGRRPALVARAKRRLERDVRAALSGAAVSGWTDDPELIAGTMALAILAGVALDRELVEFVATRHMPRSPWHGAQVVAALGPRAPADLWTSCVADLDRHPFAPWTLIAADARGDRAVRARVSRAVATALRKDTPHHGAVTLTSMPETAVTALAVEALARCRAPWARAAVARGREFLGRMQLLDRRITAALDPRLAYGAFSATPAADLLRCDVSAHALLAILASP